MAFLKNIPRMRDSSRDSGSSGPIQKTIFSVRSLKKKIIHQIAGMNCRKAFSFFTSAAPVTGLLSTPQLHGFGSQTALKREPERTGHEL